MHCNLIILLLYFNHCMCIIWNDYTF